MVLFEVNHSSAGATTLIISLGIISKPHALIVIEIAVFLLVAQVIVINRVAGLPYLLWSTAKAPADDPTR
jgi:CBS domain-containing membrane protein